jgi:hypothetical protein
MVLHQPGAEIGFTTQRQVPGKTRLDVLLAAHETAFCHFGGIPLECLYDNARTQVFRRTAGQVVCIPCSRTSRGTGASPRLN